MTNWISASFPHGISLLLVSDSEALVGVEFLTSTQATPPASQRDWTHSPQEPVLVEAERQLREYFGGERESFSVPLRLVGTAFQLSVWQALKKIPYGRTRSYREIARSIGRPTATRAVGAANGQNPLPIFVPCHRVIGSNGSLTGFGGGLDVKLALLRLEGVLLPG